MRHSSRPLGAYPPSPTGPRGSYEGDANATWCRPPKTQAYPGLWKINGGRRRRPGRLPSTAVPGTVGYARDRSRRQPHHLSPSAVLSHPTTTRPTATGEVEVEEEARRGSPALDPIDRRYPSEKPRSKDNSTAPYVLRRRDRVDAVESVGICRRFFRHLIRVLIVSVIFTNNKSRYLQTSHIPSEATRLSLRCSPEPSAFCRPTEYPEIPELWITVCDLLALAVTQIMAIVMLYKFRESVTNCTVHFPLNQIIVCLQNELVTFKLAT